MCVCVISTYSIISCQRYLGTTTDRWGLHKSLGEKTCMHIIHIILMRHIPNSPYESSVHAAAGFKSGSFRRTKNTSPKGHNSVAQPSWLSSGHEKEHMKCAVFNRF